MKPTLLARQRVISRLGELAQVLAVHDHLAAGRPVEPGDQVQVAWSCPSPTGP